MRMSASWAERSVELVIVLLAPLGGAARGFTDLQWPMEKRLYEQGKLDGLRMAPTPRAATPEQVKEIGGVPISDTLAAALAQWQMEKRLYEQDQLASSAAGLRGAATPELFKEIGGITISDTLAAALATPFGLDVARLEEEDNEECQGARTQQCGLLNYDSVADPLLVTDHVAVALAAPFGLDFEHSDEDEDALKGGLHSLVDAPFTFNYVADCRRYVPGSSRVMASARELGGQRVGHEPSLTAIACGLSQRGVLNGGPMWTMSPRVPSPRVPAPPFPPFSSHVVASQGCPRRVQVLPPARSPRPDLHVRVTSPMPSLRRNCNDCHAGGLGAVARLAAATPQPPIPDSKLAWCSQARPVVSRYIFSPSRAVRIVSPRSVGTPQVAYHGWSWHSQPLAAKAMLVR